MEQQLPDNSEAALAMPSASRRARKACVEGRVVPRASAVATIVNQPNDVATLEAIMVQSHASTIAYYGSAINANQEAGDIVSAERRLE